MSEDLFRANGGRCFVPMRATGSDTEPEPIWNFGVLPETPAVSDLIQAKPSLHARYPALIGKWDGTSTINQWDAVRRALTNPEDLIQQQPRGTCGGRAGSFTIDVVQCIMIALGKRVKFHRASHAAVYYMARKLYGDIGGNWQDENNDGVPSGSVPEALTRLGVTDREESHDPNWYGNGSDDVACQLAAGMQKALASEILIAAKDNVVTEWAPVTSAAELADGIAAGGVGIGSDTQGFTMTRDAQGFCKPSGRWDHYQVRMSIGVYGGRRGFGYNQSWGRTTPGGPLLPGHPGNSFGVDYDVQDRIIKSGRWAVIFGFTPFELEAGGVDIDWMF